MKSFFVKNTRSAVFQAGLLSLLTLIVTSCQKELEEHPKSIAIQTYYNTAAEVETAVNAIYPALRSTALLGDDYMAQLESSVDYGYGRGSFAVLNDFSGLDATNYSRTGVAWDTYYQSIRNANLVIKNAPLSSSISQADIDRYTGEAKFLRAFVYFHLVRNWGGVPIRTPDNMLVIDAKRNTPQEVYNFITADLLDAETKLPDVTTQYGRPTKWSAKTLLADVYLQVGKYPEARDKANEVIQSNKYSLVPVTTADDWQKIFGPDVVTTTEEIFYIHCSRQTGFGNYWPMYLNHPSTKLLARGGYYAVYTTTTNSVYANWDNNDLRKGLWYIWNIGLGSNTLLNKKFIDALGVTNGGNDVPWYRYADLLLIYAEAASRANSGPTVDALEALNKVHRRAYGKDPKTVSTVDFKLSDYNADSFLNLIIKERGYEFQYEGKRWLELKRTGKAAEIIKMVKGVDIAQKYYLFPIPTSEFNYNKALNPATDQNPGY